MIVIFFTNNTKAVEGPILIQGDVEVEQNVYDTMSVKEIIYDISGKIGVSPLYMSKLAFCESSHRPTVYGDGGHAYGIMQFHKPTFYEFAKRYNLTLNYYSTLDQAKLASLMVRDGYAFHWTCSKKI